MSTTTTSLTSTPPSSTPHDPYTEIELYLRRAQEEISAVFGDAEVTPVTPPTPTPIPTPTSARKGRDPTQVPPYSTPELCTARAAPPTHSQPQKTTARLGTQPAPRPTMAPRRPRLPRADPHLQEWSRGLLRDFQRLVDQELRALGGAASETTNGTLDASTPDGGAEEEKSESESGDEEAWGRDESLTGRPVRRARCPRHGRHTEQ
ncbi:uncharacterized protein LOC135109018 [Scylla paramamosain]|uniref:uncharacterized protein LOC135109018 n=1 Tax=Scylla paramamosain TaxID=85552 RepID=UPI003083BFA4